ncbi:hypothetical protein BAZO_01312 [Schinkia azotoformans LMG 9581]|uniref:Uncharacterized protein n=1 Tax=Schinkia azotoformans LMG 9581 TaxID=1131731 RepID=K6EAG7_SCHAZ|nr:hypothetical protein BAZO_01312 [Schinkia azotoformans LMG 9581]
MRFKPYWELTYKEKFFRTLWMTPFVILFHFIPEKLFAFFIPKSILVSIIWVIFIWQIVYTYKKWKRSY